MDALTALLRHIKLEPLIQTGTPAQTATQSLTETPVPPTGAAAPAEGHADATLPTPQSTHLSRTATQARLAATAEKAFAQQGAPEQDSSAFTRLSPDASLLGKTIHSAQQSSAPMPLPLPLDVANDVPAQVAQRLNSSLAHSGLFYEAHLQEWASGERSLASLHAEPHNRLLTSPDRNPLAKTGASAENTAGSTRSIAAEDNTARAAALLLPEILHPVVREQLDALDLQRVLWQGEVWPQQKAELEILPDQRQDGTEEQTPPQWHSTLRIDLPGLGQIVAQILLSGDGAQVNLRASPHAIKVLAQGSGTFREAMDAAGIALRRLDLSDAQGDENG